MRLLGPDGGGGDAQPGGGSGLQQAPSPEPVLQRVYGFYCDIRDGQLDEVTTEFEALLGRRPASLESGLKSLFKL